MKRSVVVLVGALLAVAFLAAPASAHPTTRFRACTVHVPGMCITRGANHSAGQTIIFKGSVRPLHAGFTAVVLRKRPHGSQFRRFGSVRVNSYGHIRFAWNTRPSDGVQDAPYRFKFRIVGHGMSNSTEAFVTFGE